MRISSSHPTFLCADLLSLPHLFKLNFSWFKCTVDKVIFIICSVIDHFFIHLMPWNTYLYTHMTEWHKQWIISDSIISWLGQISKITTIWGYFITTVGTGRWIWMWKHTQFWDGVCHVEIFLKVIKDDLGRVGCVLCSSQLSRLSIDSQLQRQRKSKHRMYLTVCINSIHHY